MNKATLHRMKRHFGKALIDEWPQWRIRFRGSTEDRANSPYWQRAYKQSDMFRVAGRRVRLYLSGGSIHEAINLNTRYWDGA